SRRRHTRFSRDWSSDVCSSDLAAGGLAGNLYSVGAGLPAKVLPLGYTAGRNWPWRQASLPVPVSSIDSALTETSGPGGGRLRSRSEERRVGRAGRTRWWARARV